MKRIYWVLASITTCLLASCNSSTKDAREYQTVKIDTVTSANGQTYLQYPGKVKAAQDISLAFRVSGTIRKIYVKDGARVQAGQLLAELDPTDYQVQLDATEAEYKQIKAEAERVMATVQRERNYSQRQRQGCVRTETNHRQISAPQRPAGLHPPLRSLQRLYTKTSV